MEYKEYMNRIQQRLKEMSEEEKNRWIYHYARVQSQNRREDILNSLNFLYPVTKTFHQVEFYDFIEDVKEGNLQIPAYEEETFDYGYDRDFETYYSKNCELLNQLNDYIDDAFQYVNCCQYKWAFDIFQNIQSLDYEYVMDYGDIYELSFQELFENDLVDISIQKYSLYYLYTAFQLHFDIPQMYSYFNHSKVKYVLSDLVAFGPEEIMLSEDEYKQWIAFLEKQPGVYAAKLLKDICLLYGNVHQLTKMILKIGAQHPSLYLDMIENNILNHQLEDARIVASQAFEQLDEKLVIRSKIVELLIPYFPDEKKLYEIAFLSNPQVKSCLQLYKLDCDVSSIKNIFFNIGYARYSDTNDIEQKTATLTSDQKQILLFLLGNYKEVINKCQEDQNYLGWTSSLKGNIIPLLLMYLKPEKIHYVADDVIMRDLSQMLMIDEKEFNQLFHFWKEKYMIDGDFKKKCIQWLENEMDKRTEAIVGGTHRRSYYKVAKQLVVLAEILYVYKKITNIDTFIKDYIRMYSRKPAFKAEILKYFKQR